MSKKHGDLLFEYRKDPRRPYVKNLEDGTTQIVIEVTQEEMKEIIVPNIIKAYE